MDGTEYNFEEVDTLCYVGMIITSNGEERIEIDERVAKGAKSSDENFKSKKCLKKYKAEYLQVNY